MINNKIILHVDEFNNNKISGWAAFLNQEKFNELPFTIFINDILIIEVNEFNFREDLISSGMENGNLGFSLDLSLGNSDKIEIYCKHSDSKIWSGVVGKAYNDFVQIDLLNNLNTLNVVDNPETCLIYFYEEIFYSNNKNNLETIDVYELETTVDNAKIYYFQLLTDDRSNFSVASDDYIVTSQRVGEVNELILYEYFIIQKKINDSKGKPIKILNSFGASNISINFSINKSSKYKDFFYLASFANTVIIRSNPRINFLSNSLYPVIEHKLIDFLDLQPSILKNSLFYFDFQELVWSPTICNFDIKVNDVKNVKFFNKFNNSFKLFSVGDSPVFCLENFNKYYNNFGDIAFIEFLYLYLLRRPSDPNGIADNLLSFRKMLKEKGQALTIIHFWNLFISSGEFKSKANKYFPPLNFNETEQFLS